MNNLKYFENINKMPRLSKNAIIRKDTQKLLDELECGINPHKLMCQLIK